MDEQETTSASRDASITSLETAATTAAVRADAVEQRADAADARTDDIEARHIREAAQLAEILRETKALREVTVQLMQEGLTTLDAHEHRRDHYLFIVYRSLIYMSFLTFAIVSMRIWQSAIGPSSDDNVNMLNIVADALCVLYFAYAVRLLWRGPPV